MVGSASRVGSINVLLQTDIRGGVAGLKTFAATVEKTGVSASRSVSGIDRSIGSLNRTLGSLNGRGFTSVTVGALRARTAVDQLRGLALAAGVAVGGLVPAAIVSSLVRTADSAHRLGNQLRTVTTDSNDLKSTQDALFQVAQRTRSAFDSTVTIYARTARATEHLGLSQQKLLRITETVQKAFAIGGASSAEAQGAAIQLSQGIASNRFSGEEFRSVAENAPVLLRGMAESLGVNIGKLREMAHAGELTADVVTRAIIDASQRIDEEFAKTTSTIEQAWVKVGNAVVKYAMDSENASVASAGLVGVLNALSANIDTTADALLVLGGAAAAIFTARKGNDAASWAAGLRNARVEAIAAARANMDLALAQQASARQTLASTKAAYEMSRVHTVSASTRARFGKELQAAALADALATKQATQAVATHAAAQRAATASAMAYAAAGRAASAAWSFIGGPFGAALLAVGAAMYVVSSRAQEAEARTDRYAEAIARARDESDQSAGALRRIAEEFFKVADGAGTAERIVAQRQAMRDLAITTADLVEAYNAAGRGLLNLSTAFSEGYREIGVLVDRFKSGEISAEEFREALNSIASANPDLSSVIVDLQRLGDQADAERGRIDALTESLQRLSLAWARGMEAIAGLSDGGVGEKGDRLIPHLSNDQFNSRFGQPYAQDWKEIFPDLYKPAKKGGASRTPRKTADDRFDNSVQAIRDRIEALRLEREMLGATYFEQVKREEALKLEQEALKQVREEARRKGDADWQSAQISDEKRAKIEEVSAALAAEADATRRATEAMELQKDILHGVFNDIRSALDDGKITIEEWGDIFINVLDKVIDKLQTDLVDALAGMGGGGGGGGLFGFLGSLLGGGLGAFPSAPIGLGLESGIGLFDSGGAVLGGNVVPFGPKTKRLGAGILADSGFGPRHFPAVLEEGETVLTKNMMDRTMGVLSSIPDCGRTQIEVEVFVKDDGKLGAIARQAGAQAGAEQADVRVNVYDRALPDRMQQINQRPRRRG